MNSRKKTEKAFVPEDEKQARQMTCLQSFKGRFQVSSILIILTITLFSVLAFIDHFIITPYFSKEYQISLFLINFKDKMKEMPYGYLIFFVPLLFLYFERKSIYKDISKFIIYTYKKQKYT